MLDLAIRGGEVVDGTGAPRRRADVGIRDGRVVALGRLDEPAHRTIDASDRIVAPGFVDVHTHYDAQVFWDPYLTPSLLHGVTTMVGGNCGFTIAPLVPDAAEYLMRMLARVEGMPLETLENGVPWDWTTTADYYTRIEGRVAPNVGFKVGHSALRRLVMGEEASRRAATDEEIDAMRALLARELESGGLGFSSSWGAVHRDGNGDPVPSRWAEPAELVALAEVCSSFPGTSLEFVPDQYNAWDAGRSVMIAMSVAARRPIDWNLLIVTADMLDDALVRLAAGTEARERGGRLTALTMPITPVQRYSFRSGFGLDTLPGWAKPMALPPSERLAILRDPAGRRELEELAVEPGPKTLVTRSNWDERVIVETFSPATKRYEGRLVADIAAEEGKRPFDALIDIVCADELRTVFSPPAPVDTDADWQARLLVWRDGRALVGGSDAGAHLDFLSTFNVHTWFLEHAVRRHELLPIEEAVWHLTGAPARLYGLRDRGRLTEGAWADAVVFDEHTIGSGPVQSRFDLPAGAARLYADPVGVGNVLVNGVEVAADGAPTGALPGRLLRARRDTETPALA
jgi:N-acyl-D-aspartate/D-glutamate deacylase